MILIIAGSRDINDYDLVEREVQKLAAQWTISEIVSGGAKGVDTAGELYAYNHKIPCTVMKAKWHLYGKKAGPMRNREMARYAANKAPGSGCLVIHNGSPGSLNMIETAHAHGLRVHAVKV